MDDMLREALRKYRELRNQFENCLLGEEGDVWEAQAKKFLAKRPCWNSDKIVPVAPQTSPGFHPDPLFHLRDHWIKFWRVVCGRDLADADLILPVYRQGFDWPVIAPRDLTAQQLYELTESTRFFPCWKFWPTLDVLKVEEDYLKPTAEMSVVLIRPSVKPDTYLSYDQAVTQHLVFLGLRHRIILEPFGFWLNKDYPTEAQMFKIPPHFDPDGWTRTSSLDPGGLVADAYWSVDNGGFWVDWSDRVHADPYGGIRLAVS